MSRTIINSFKCETDSCIPVTLHLKHITAKFNTRISTNIPILNMFKVLYL